MSIAVTLCPRAASISRTAMPMRPAPPVTRMFIAPFPRTNLNRHHAAIDAQIRSRDEGRTFRAEEKDRRRNLFRLSEAPNRGQRQKGGSLLVGHVFLDASHCRARRD